MCCLLKRHVVVPISQFSHTRCILSQLCTTLRSRVGVLANKWVIKAYYGKLKPELLVCIAHFAQNSKANNMHQVTTLYDALFT